MDYVTIMKMFAIILISLIIYVIVMKGIIRDGRRLNDSYMGAIMRYAMMHNAGNIINPIRDNDFFYMTNDGSNPCDLKKGIKYVDYIGNSSIYMEIKTDDRDN